MSYGFKVDADTITSRFRGWLEEEQNFNRPIGYDDVVSFARGARIETKQYELDRALPGRIRDATNSYVGSYPPLGAGVYRIKRSAVGEVLAGLQAGAGVVIDRKSVVSGTCVSVPGVLGGSRSIKKNPQNTHTTHIT